MKKWELLLDQKRLLTNTLPFWTLLILAVVVGYVRPAPEPINTVISYLCLAGVCLINTRDKIREQADKRLYTGMTILFVALAVIYAVIWLIK